VTASKSGELADRLKGKSVVFAIGAVVGGGLLLGLGGVFAPQTAATASVGLATIGVVIAGARKHATKSRKVECAGATVTGIGVGGATWTLSELSAGYPWWLALALDAVLVGGVVLAYTPGPPEASG